MNSYAWAISIHVVSALLGLGQVAAIAVASSTSAAAEPGSALLLRRLMLGVRASLGLILLSGMFIEYSLGGPYHRSWWFRLSVFGWLVLGALSVFVTRALGRRGSMGTEPSRLAVARVTALMCAIAATIAVLMELKPF